MFHLSVYCIIFYQKSQGIFAVSYSILKQKQIKSVKHQCGFKKNLTLKFGDKPDMDTVITRAFKVIFSTILMLIAFSCATAENIGLATTKGYDVVIDFTSAGNGSLITRIEGKDDNNNIEIKVEAKKITVSQNIDGKSTALLNQKVNIPTKKKGTLTIYRRGTSLGFAINDEMIYRAADIERGPGKNVSVTEDKWKANSADIYPLDPVYFTDDFMRDATTDGDYWEILSGEWVLRSAWDDDPHLFATSKNQTKKLSGGQNPFEWISWGKPAMAIVGEEGWEDYNFKCAFRADVTSIFGLIVNYQDEKNYIYATITSAADKSKEGNRITLYQVLKGKKSILSESYGGFIPNQWYTFSVESSISGVKVFLDGKERLYVKNLPLWKGMAGIYTYGDSMIEIDDIYILGKDLDFDYLHELNSVQIADRFARDNNGMEVWARNSNEWEASNNLTGINLNYRYYSRDIHGSKQWVIMDVAPTNYDNGKVSILLCGMKNDKNIGYRIEINTANHESTVTMYHNKEVLVERVLKTLTTKLANNNENVGGEVYLMPSTQSTLRFLKEENTLRFSIDDEDILTAQLPQGADETVGSRPAYQATGRYLSAKNVMALTYNTLDYTFTTAPTDWFGEGTWAATTRWACDPEWSFLAGYSNGDVALWSKNIVQGDQTFQAYLGIKMEYPREYNTYYERYRDLNISICTDGQNPLSGYSGVYGSKDKRMILYRNGKEVASQNLDRNYMPSGDHHRLWFDVKLEKKGNKITFSGVISATANGKPISVSFEDSDPIEGGVPVIWSNNNAISIARARLNYENPPIPREGPFTVIDMPWHPEFISVGTPLKLTLPMVSTSGKDVELNIEQKVAPPEAKNKPSAVKVAGDTITFSPNFTGLYQYKINGVADGVTSPSVYLDTYVFDPTPQNKNTENALVRYDFTEGEGNIIHDTSGYGEPLNLNISYKTKTETDENGKNITVETQNLSAQWISGQGIAVDSLSRVISENPADKILAFRENGRISVEMWLSLNTIYPENPANADQWLCSFLEFNSPTQKDYSKRWFTFFQSGGGYYLSGMNNGKYSTTNGFNNTRTGLQHVIISYNPDDKLTCFYKNGKLLAQVGNFAWNFDKWAEGAHLILGNAIAQIGNNPTFAAAFPGNIYYLAIYNRTFTTNEALNSYNSGPKPY